MINQRTEERAALYLLDQLAGEEKALFEKELRDSPDLQKLVHELGSGLYEPFLKGDTPSRPDLLEGILQQLPEDHPQAKPVVKATQPAFPWSFIWAAAALVLLGMNLVLLFILNEQSSVRPGDPATLKDSTGTEPAGEISGELELTASERKILEARISRLEEELATSEDRLDLYQFELEKAGERESEVNRYNAEWQREYARLAARILPFFEPNDGLGRFTVIEMVDNEAFNQDLPRRGFADLAGRFLTGEGNIAGVGTDEFVGPVVEGAGVLSSTTDPTQPGLSPIARTAQADIAGNSNVPSSVTGPGTNDTGDRVDKPTGFTVWRDDEQKGFLDLYNLPQLDEGQEAYLWVRSSELEPYLPVGVVPQLENGTGSIFYSVDEPNFTPTEILITAEEAGAEGPEPGSTVILRGP